MGLTAENIIEYILNGISPFKELIAIIIASGIISIPIVKFIKNNIKGS